MVEVECDLRAHRVEVEGRRRSLVLGGDNSGNSVVGSRVKTVEVVGTLLQVLSIQIRLDRVMAGGFTLILWRS